MNKYKKSHALFNRAAKVIPGGIYGHYSPAHLIVVPAYPFYSSRGKGAYFWDVDGNRFIDYLCAYGPMVLGYCNAKVDAAASREQAHGSCVTGASPLMVELAEYMTELISGMKWAFFAKNGGDVTNYAVMVARAATGRKKIIAINGGYHGVEPWMQSPGHTGVLKEDHENYVRIPWNDYQEFEKTVAEHRGDVAGFIATPYHHPVFHDSELPSDNYWQKIEALCKKEGILLIIDDVRCGFRIDMAGSHHYYGFTPDLVCYCKAMANGYPISALLGVEPLKKTASEVFHTGSYWFSSAPMAAALACLRELKRINAPDKMKATGEKLTSGLVDVAFSHGYRMNVSGMPSMPYLRLSDDPTQVLHQEWCAECTLRGAYFAPHHNWFISCAHGNAEIKRTLEIADSAFTALKKKKK
ncbi:MAG TPA: aminotransferase class III-fold pyridoxal phosphate-dependent enzyme [Spirochaetota bacterium]|nr:aminotransferase class III-fold pyridoxal phosphate-dependent enzyme [Spirochaetota bacterium]